MDFFRTANTAENWCSILEIRLRHPLFFLLCVSDYIMKIIFPLAKFTLLRKGCLTVWPWHAVYEFYMLFPRMEFGEAIMKERWEAFGEKKIYYFFPRIMSPNTKGYTRLIHCVPKFPHPIIFLRKYISLNAKRIWMLSEFTV